MFNPLLFYSAGELSKGLIAYYKFDSNSQNSVDSVIATETSISYANSGIISNSATFNGTSSLVSIAYKSVFDFNTSTSDVPFSASFWIYPSNVTVIEREIASKYSSTTSQWVLRQRGTKIEAAIFNSIGAFKYYQFNDATYNLVANTWQHVVLTYDGLGLNGSFKLYFNSVLKSGAAVTNSGTYTRMSSSNVPVMIGSGRADSPAYFYNGRLDEIAIWRNKILTQTQINSLYNSGAGITYPLPF